MLNERFKTLAVLILIAVFSCFNGCDSSFVPFDEEAGFYSIYGALNLYAERNYIRVRDLNTTLSADTAGRLDATVSLHNLTNGDTEVLRDSTVTFQGVVTHNFYTNAKIQEASEYRVTVEGPGNRAASVSAVTPYESSISVDPGDAEHECAARVNISIEPLMEESSLVATMTFVARNVEQNPDTFLINPEITSTDLPQQGLRATVFSFRPIDAINDQYSNPEPTLDNVEFGQNPCTVLMSDTFTLNLRHYGPGFDTLRSDSIRIEGGEGRFIAYYDTTLKFRVPAVSPFIENE